MAEISIVAGLGNPGKRYADTRHNIGFCVLDRMVHNLGCSWKVNGEAEVAEVQQQGRKLLLIRPLSFMNLSGRPIAGMLSYYKLSPVDLIVVHDDIDLPFCSLRIKIGGGDGGHNGLKSITATLNTADYVRVRLGVGRPPPVSESTVMEVSDWVLAKFGRDEQAELPGFLDRAESAVLEILEKGVLSAQNRYN